MKEIDFSTKSPQSGRIFRFGFSFSVWSTNNFGKIFYSLDEKLIENPVNISIELFHRTKYRWNLYKNVARLITFLTKLLVGFYDKFKKLHEFFSRNPFLNLSQGHYSWDKHGADRKNDDGGSRWWWFGV